VALSRSDAASAERRAEIEARVKGVTPKTLWLELTHRPRGLLDATGRREELSSLHGQSIAAFCGIGNPAGFRHTLASAGLNAGEVLELPDHCPYDEPTMARLTRWLEGVPQAAAAVCTQKDLVKIPQEQLAGRPLWSLEIELAIVRGEEALRARLNELGRQIQNSECRIQNSEF
jgi:tetraacyldisaccharide 4'-kinase